ncbi:MAG: glycine cleavage system protein GcvH [Coriobacteriia bacterium]|nr:glycine cleavage system protein GcvH [Coriobacteriia bacterium]
MATSTHPDDRLYTSDHEWVKIEDDTARVGITEFAQEQLGDIVYIELPDEGASLSAGEPFGEVESVKSVSELFMPGDGVVVEVNTALEETPDLINSDPYGEGWIARIKFSDLALDELLDTPAYCELCEA